MNCYKLRKNNVILRLFLWLTKCKLLLHAINIVFQKKLVQKMYVAKA
jgi:hypothetical protein